MHRASARVDVRSSRPYACHTRPVRDSLHARLRKSVRPICFPSQRKMHQASQPATTPFSRVRRAGRRSQEATVNTLTPAEHIASNPASEARLGGCRAESRVGAHSSISSAAWVTACTAPAACRTGSVRASGCICPARIRESAAFGRIRYPSARAGQGCQSQSLRVREKRVAVLPGLLSGERSVKVLKRVAHWLLMVHLSQVVV